MLLRRAAAGGVIMADQILTLCEKCAEEIKSGGFKVKPVAGRTTTDKKKACENCGQRMGGTVKQYIVGGRGR